MPTIPGLEIDVIPVTALSQNCSLYWDAATRVAAVVDPGGDVDRILARLADGALRLEAILLTHGHLDHVGGAAELARRAGGDTPVSIIGPHAADAFLLEQVTENAARFGLSGMENVRADRFVTAGERLHYAGRTLEVRHVPGHTPGHVVFFDADRRFLFAGDTLFRGAVGRTDFAYGDERQLLNAIRDEILPLGDDVIVLPGHGGMTRIGDERRHNPFLQTR
ncbi:metallo-beta-lactamase [Ameyamaea chiangmaiensis NBRC 103196]|uniref:MBL fold metallo-hydrolase n=1 Tax=Ameyamaea chiangmaiensis TaxID=442969 RepID=A0A850PIB7_9PROT|nr:MBL fold metallo-hydrolase [Ameyamaea chiangmaiensis]MBS4074994.1 MBL fold metallo-hydrolase [Ameyamaea chiangmaiensis]NVN41552.1 MBL fold metallo-hydrolase [Ameyamaea chiangmaiensis]GBQ66015.1 metallo-beta-lactamase [Ameyamaea chiangmaiensis NBRC 103196]